MLLIQILAYNRFKISALTLDEEFELPYGPCSVSDIQYNLSISSKNNK